MSDTVKIALVQADLRWRQPAANREHLGAMIAGMPGADLYLLPETFATGFLGDQGLIETMDGESVQWMVEQAESHDAAIAGSLALDDDGRLHNRFLFVQPDGRIDYYDKAHLFGHGGEGERYRSGNRRVEVDFRARRFDLQVCYDLRFPVWCRNDDRFDVQLFVANWPAARVDAWRSLLKARAIENQAFVIGVNCTGTDGNQVVYPGASSAWSGLGECLVELDDTEQTVMVELDFAALDELRRSLPFLADRDAFTLGRR